MNKEVGFTIDAGLIQRLGYELMGRAETAVSELIKNSYDADATIVDVEFIDSIHEGGTLLLSDNGIGMNEIQMINGFMRISSTDKIHNPSSKKFHRTKAGRKGIGRFAAQRLGEQLIIITQTRDSDKAIKIVFDWNKYKIDVDLSSITFPLEFIDKEKEEGTTLIIRGLREGWSAKSIMRVHKYVIDLFQPNYLSERSQNNYSAVQNEESFQVNFYQVIAEQKIPIINDKLAFFNKSLAIIEGFIDEQHKGTVLIQSDSLKIDDLLSIEYSPDENELGIQGYSKLKDVYFKAYYFIYNRPDYYRGRVSKLELSGIQDYAKTSSGIRLYRNGFRVLPYGEATDDWLNIDRRWGQVSGAIGSLNIPLANRNLFGFVEITDPEGKIFEETASREGLIENEAFKQLIDFLHKSIIGVRQRLAEGVLLFKEQIDTEDFTQDSEEKQKSTEDKLKELEEIIDYINEKEEEQESGQGDQDNQDYNRKNEDSKTKRKQLVESIRKEIEEASMLRVLAGMGLTIGEFSHEVKQFQPSVFGYISKIKEEELSENAISLLKGITLNLNNLISYTGYFSATVSQNINRETEPIDVLAVLDIFNTTIENDLNKNNIIFTIDPWEFNVITVPMHKSEWSSILFNLYTNAKKAINRAKSKGRILVEVGKDGNYIFLNFSDNGDGIKLEYRSRVFNAFFTTSTPAGFDAPKNDQMLGSGLGLKIVKDILISYNGSISISDPSEGYNTCFRILVPRNNKN